MFSVICSLLICDAVLVEISGITWLGDFPDLSFVQNTQILQTANSSAPNNTFLHNRIVILSLFSSLRR